MARNRIIYNVQDVFIGSTSSEENPFVTGVPGHEILKRLNRVQSFGYAISFQEHAVNSLGKSTPSTRQKAEAASVQLELNYITEGITNEERVGFYTQNQSSSEQKNLFYDFADPARNKDRRNLYVCTTKDGNNDIRESSTTKPNVSGVMDVNDYVHKDSKDLNVIAFQNCYVSSHSISAEIGQLASTSMAFQSDNIIMFSSGSGIHLPYVGSKSGVVEYSGTKIIVPKHFSEKNDEFDNVPHAFSQGDITVDIYKEDSSSINFQNQIVQAYQASTSLARDNLMYVGNKLPTDKPLVFPITTNCTIGFVNTGLLEGNLFDNLNLNSNYNLIVKLKKDSDTVVRHMLSGAKLIDIRQDGSLGAQERTSLSFSCPNDFENNEKGFFVSGSMTTFRYQIIDNSGNFVVNNSSQNISSDFFPPF
jgi:hypothetical protein